MVLLSNAGSLLVAIMAASAQLALAIPQAEGTSPSADASSAEASVGEHKEGDDCDVMNDRIVCDSDTSMLFCSNNKWVAFSNCTLGTVCRDGSCVYPDTDSASEGTAPSSPAGSEQEQVEPSPAGTEQDESLQANESNLSSVAVASSAVSVGATDVAATDASAGASDVAATDASAGASDVAATDESAADTAATEASQAEPSAAESEAASDESGGGDSSDTSSGGSYGITCDKFKEAVGKASSAISKSYPTPSDTQCNAFIKGMSKGGFTSAREAAMFLANILWESDGLQAKEEYDCKDLPDWCAQNYKTPEDVSGKTYWGRGYIQLTWHYNYEAASEGLYGDDRLTKDPSQVATNEDTAWAVSFWFWKENVHSDPGVQAGNFGSSINKINGALECKGAAQDKAKKRYEMYTAILPIFAPSEKPKEAGCYN
ncbi:hypothetical protein IWW50_001520 [Coemansia erecta]|nr:hypothetical protein GGF43_000252 [Coemansia sp. RSA 2618]KAJ2828176.1 hypothetical protein IWW50_001520 [Coemansia erecta]